MLTPEALRRKSAEAAERIERERVLAEERRKLEEQARRLAEEVLQREVEKRARLKRQAAHKANDLLRESIVVASRDDRVTKSPVAFELMPYVSELFSHWAESIRS